MRYTVPSFVRPEYMEDSLKVRFRVGRVYKTLCGNVRFNEKRVIRKKSLICAPGEMEELTLKKELLSGVSWFEKDHRQNRGGINMEEKISYLYWLSYGICSLTVRISENKSCFCKEIPVEKGKNLRRNRSYVSSANRNHNCMRDRRKIS